MEYQSHYSHVDANHCDGLRLEKAVVHQHLLLLNKHYKVIYFEALDTIVGCIKNWFEQEGYAIYQQLEDILVTNTSEEDYEDKVRDVTAFYGDDFNEELLKT